MMPPCYDCRERRSGCHSPAVCARWAQFEAAKQAEYQERMQTGYAEQLLDTYIHERGGRRRRSKSDTGRGGA